MAGAAWLSSVRGVNCPLNWVNERNPCCLLYVSGETARLSREEGGDDAKSAWPFDALGYTRATMGCTMGRETARWSKSLKTSLSSDRSLQFDSVKLESLVIAGQLYRGEYVLKSCTHRPSTQGSREYPKVRFMRN
jgi:hypothetical protein